MASAFLIHFGGDWRTNTYKEFEWGQWNAGADAIANMSRGQSWAIHSGTGAGVFCYQYHMRVFTEDLKRVMGQSEDFLVLQRTKGTIKAKWQDS